MQEQLNKRRNTLPLRAAHKHVVFAAVVQSNGNATNNNIASTAPLRPSDDHVDKNHRHSTPGCYDFDTPPTLVKTPWELQRHPTKRWSWPARNSSERPRRKPTAPLLDCLPQDVRGLILKHLDGLHSNNLGVCANCLLQDLYNLSLISKTWHCAVESHMYRNLQLPTYHPVSRVMPRNRFQLLLRTLRERPDLAHRVSRIHASTGHVSQRSDQRRSDFIADLANIVRACPNLKAFDGMYTGYRSGEASDLLLKALAASKDLREYVWLLEGRGSHPQELPSFLNQHTSWAKLETLVIRESGIFLGQGSMYSILRRLPALQQLALVELSSFSFHDGTLQALTGLRSLRLEALEGLTDLGLEQALPKLAGSLQSLGLIDLDIKSLRTLSNILVNIGKLEKLTFVQDSPPGLPLGAEVSMATEIPLLSSSSVSYLYWEIPIPGSANQAIETSIRLGGFPSLQTLQTPCDSDGIFQALCRPLARKQLTEPQVKAYEREETKGYSRDLAHARTAAQLRIRGSRHTPAVSVVVQEEDDVQFTHFIGGYVGDVRSAITYELEPVFEGTSQALGRVEHVVNSQTSDCVVNKKVKKKHRVERRRELRGLF